MFHLLWTKNSAVFEPKSYVIPLWAKRVGEFIEIRHPFGGNGPPSVAPVWKHFNFFHKNDPHWNWILNNFGQKQFYHRPILGRLAGTSFELKQPLFTGHCLQIYLGMLVVPFTSTQVATKNLSKLAPFAGGLAICHTNFDYLIFLQSFWKSCSNVPRSFEPGRQSISLHFSWSTFVSHRKESRLSGKDLRKSSGKGTFINRWLRCLII